MNNQIELLKGFVFNTVPTVYQEGMSYYEVLLQVVRKLNELIEKSNEYFSQSVKDNLIEILHAWQEDGTLDVIIDEALQTQIDVVQDQIDEISGDIDSLENKTSEIGISIKQPPYNAKGNGVDDDTLAIQQALNDTPAGKALIIPRGTYLITDTLLIDKPVTIMGYNVGSYGYTVLRADLTGKVESTPVIRITSEGSATQLNNIYINNSLTTKIHDGIKVNGGDEYVKHMSFNNVWVVGFKNNYSFTNIFLCRFRDCYAAYGNNGFSISGFSTSLVFEGCYANNNANIGYLITNNVYSSFISCAADNNVIAYRISNSRGVKLVACGAEVSSITAFYLTGNKGISIDSPFGVENGISTANSSYASFIMVEDDNESISVDNPIEETTGEGGRNHSIIFGSNATGSINNPKTVLGAYYGNKVSYNGQFFGSSKPSGTGHYQGKVVWNKSPRLGGVNNPAGWICVNDTEPFEWAGLGVIDYPIP